MEDNNTNPTPAEETTDTTKAFEELNAKYDALLENYQSLTKQLDTMSAKAPDPKPADKTADESFLDWLGNKN